MLFFNWNTYSQTKKFSLEVNYPFIVQQNQLEKNTGIIDGSFKYQFKELNSIKLGVSYTYTYAKGENDLQYRYFKQDYHFHHLGGFVTYNIKTIEKLHLFTGAGYTFLTARSEVLYYGAADPGILKDQKTESASGFNLVLGASYDITESFYT